MQISSCSIILNKPKFSHYLAGMLEGDGSIKVPGNTTNRKLAPSITIVFVDKDLILAQRLTEILNGTLNKGQGNYYVLSVYKLSCLYDIAKAVNGKFRTPKLEALYRLIDWLNGHGKFDHIKKLPLENSPILSNSWLAGFSDCDSTFLVAYEISKITGLTVKNNFTYRLSQRSEYHRDIINFSYLPMMEQVAKEFGINVTTISRDKTNTKTGLNYIEKGYLVTVKSLVATGPQDLN